MFQSILAMSQAVDLSDLLINGVVHDFPNDVDPSSVILEDQQRAAYWVLISC